MIEREDYRKYLSVDNGKGLLLKKSDAYLLEKNGIDYKKYSNLNDLIFMVSRYLDDHYEEDIDEMEDVLIHLMEFHYYYEVNK